MFEHVGVHDPDGALLFFFVFFLNILSGSGGRFTHTHTHILHHRVNQLNDITARVRDSAHV